MEYQSCNKLAVSRPLWQRDEYSRCFLGTHGSSECLTDVRHASGFMDDECQPQAWPSMLGKDLQNQPLEYTNSSNSTPDSIKPPNPYENAHEALAASQDFEIQSILDKYQGSGTGLTQPGVVSNAQLLEYLLAANAQAFPGQRRDDSPHGSSTNSYNSKPRYQSSSSGSLYKTELCRSWCENLTCRYGGKCQFAHGHAELRPIKRHPKYKTEICRTFAKNGTCPYGIRCRFIHMAVPQPHLENPGLCYPPNPTPSRSYPLPTPLDHATSLDSYLNPYRTRYSSGAGLAGNTRVGQASMGVTGGQGPMKTYQPFPDTSQPPNMEQDFMLPALTPEQLGRNLRGCTINPDFPTPPPAPMGDPGSQGEAAFGRHAGNDQAALPETQHRLAIFQNLTQDGQI